MLKRKLVRASLFGNGLVIVIASVCSINYRQPVKATATVSIDPIIRQLETFDSSFIELSGMPSNVLSDVPKIHLNARMIKYVKDYNDRNLEALEKVRERGTICFPLMDSIFNSYHLPVELKYLAAIESELKTKALSHVGAAGPWQLMPSTAHDLSLKIKGNYDERTSYSKSTVAAAKYLRDLYREFGDWLLVIASYNSGPGKVIDAIKQSGSHNFWVLQNYLPAETRGHVKRFIATHYYFEDYGSVVTLTKSETTSYRNSVSKYIASQKTEKPKELVLAVVTKNTLPDKELSERN